MNKIPKKVFIVILALAVLIPCSLSASKHILASAEPELSENLTSAAQEPNTVIENEVIPAEDVAVQAEVISDDEITDASEITDTTVAATAVADNSDVTTQGNTTAADIATTAASKAATTVKSTTKAYKKTTSDATTTTAISTTTTTKKETTTAATTAKAITESLSSANKSSNSPDCLCPLFSSSKLLEGEKAVDSWRASSGDKKVYAEKIELDLNVYDENGVMTNETVKRNIYIAKIDVPASEFKSIAALQSTGERADTLENIAKNVNAVFAVNGEMSSHKREEFFGFFNAATDAVDATVIKHSAVAQLGSPSPSLTMSNTGVWQYPVSIERGNIDSLIDSGVITSISYTYPVLWNGKPWYIENGIAIAPMWNERSLTPDNPSGGYFNDHVIVGQVDADTYIVMISEGFNRGYMCDLLDDLNVRNAYWNNGGHCATMYVKGHGVINRPGDTHLCHAASALYVD